MSLDLLKEYLNINGIITIVGSAGSGKTALLFSIIEALYNKKKQLLVSNEINSSIISARCNKKVEDYKFLFKKDNISDRLSFIDGDKDIQDKRYKYIKSNIEKKFDFLYACTTGSRDWIKFIKDFLDKYDHIYIDNLNGMLSNNGTEIHKDIDNLYMAVSNYSRKNINRKIFFTAQSRRNHNISDASRWYPSSSIMHISNIVIGVEHLEGNLNINIVKHRTMNNGSFSIPIWWNSFGKVD